MKLAAGEMAAGRASPQWGIVLFLAVLWGQFFVVLAPSWSGATYYDYGWLVPPFAAYFAWRRWQDLEHFEMRPAAGRAWWILALAGVLLIAPLRIVEQVDVFWRLALWTHAAVVFGLTHLVLLIVSGWRVSAALLPATLFAMFAVPLPSAMEQEIVQGLSRQVVHLASGALPLAGYPVEVAGHSLIIRGELLDVAEGCSGIRSFQSSAMAGICLGEMLRLSIGRRMVLLLSGIVMAGICNAGRVFVLARLAHEKGSEASDAAHDAVGFWVLLCTYGGILFVAWILLRFRVGRRTITRRVGKQDG